MPLDYMVQQAAERLKARLVQLYPADLDEVRVYGSRARGDAHEESDLDVLILTRGDVNRIDSEVFRATRLVLEELGYPFPISPLVMSRAHFDELLRRERLFAQTVLKEGVPV